MDTKLDFEGAKGFVRVELEIDTSGFANRQDSLDDYASARVDGPTQESGDNSYETTAQLMGCRSLTILGKTVSSLGHIVASVGNLVEVKSQTEHS